MAVLELCIQQDIRFSDFFGFTQSTQSGAPGPQVRHLKAVIHKWQHLHNLSDGGLQRLQSVKSMDLGASFGEVRFVAGDYS